MVKVFLTELVREAKLKDPSVEKLINAFKAYKQTNNPGKMFGRDAGFSNHSGARLEELKHAHVLNERDFVIKKLEVRPQFQRKSDAFLIYCVSFASPDTYLILDILWRDGHKTVRDVDVMNNYVDIVTRFRKGH